MLTPSSYHAFSIACGSVVLSSDRVLKIEGLGLITGLCTIFKH